VLNGESSDWGEVDSGIIQGSVLGPPLFTVYIDDVDVILELLSIFKKFADDTKLGQVMRGEEDRGQLQAALTGLEEWAATWGMEFQVGKCKIMHVGRSNPGYEYQMGGSTLGVTEEERDIGMVVDKSLKPSKQCAKAAQKARTVLGQIARAFHFRDRHVFKKLYVQYICEAALRICGPSLGPLDAGGQRNIGECAEESGQNDFWPE